VGPRAGLDAGARRKILCPCRGSNPDRPARSQTLYRLSYRGYSRTVEPRKKKTSSKPVLTFISNSDTSAARTPRPYFESDVEKVHASFNTSLRRLEK
jgi:hypothetical protein